MPVLRTFTLFALAVLAVFAAAFGVGRAVDPDITGGGRSPEHVEVHE